MSAHVVPISERATRRRRKGNRVQIHFDPEGEFEPSASVVSNVAQSDRSPDGSHWQDPATSGQFNKVGFLGYNCWHHLINRETDAERSMTRQIVYTEKAAKPPATYSQAVKAAGLVFVSGTSPADAATGVIIGSTIQEQTRQCLTNVQAILEAAGSSLAKAVSFTVVLADEDDFAGMNEEWLRWFPSNPPARQGAKLPARIPGLKISIAAIAEG